ncbi:MAG: hypothetical protein A3G87_09450 [Omnitrophica bacterium RIFCSPLOWO2_12_FULL_50_11]|nr:MAG: hypothetical protein A3G87_09450 [Omnitrophica bacterium RIFCSPLOWO2_12_FULL_50_11]
MERKRRSIAKTLSYRVFSTLLMMTVFWILTGRLLLALQVAFIDMIVKIIGYYFHERLWNRIPYGRVKPPEYQI